MCEMCKKVLGEETHHMIPQVESNEKGYIGSFHKNHPANLMSICEKCHDKLHNENHNKVVKKIIRKKTTKGYILQEIKGSGPTQSVQPLRSRSDL